MSMDSIAREAVKDPSMSCRCRIRLGGVALAFPHARPTASYKNLRSGSRILADGTVANIYGKYGVDYRQPR
jgi:hypothetical protein